MRTQLEKLVRICERSEARIKRQLLAARAHESQCRQNAVRANACLDEVQHELRLVNRQVVDFDGLYIHRLQSTERYLDGLREDLERLRGDARRAHYELAIAEHERSELSARMLAASIKLENARLREAKWCCLRDTISASQQEEYSTEAWVLRLR